MLESRRNSQPDLRELQERQEGIAEAIEGAQEAAAESGNSEAAAELGEAQSAVNYWEARPEFPNLPQADLDQYMNRRAEVQAVLCDITKETGGDC